MNTRQNIEETATNRVKCELFDAEEKCPEEIPHFELTFEAPTQKVADAIKDGILWAEELRTYECEDEWTTAGVVKDANKYFFHIEITAWSIGKGNANRNYFIRKSQTGHNLLEKIETPIESKREQF